MCLSGEMAVAIILVVFVLPTALGVAGFVLFAYWLDGRNAKREALEAGGGRRGA